MSLFLLIIIFSIISGVLSMIGGVVLLGRAEWVKKFSIHFISFAAGTLLATAFLDLLPEALEMHGEAKPILMATLLGIVSFFIIEKLIYRFHAHYYEDENQHNHAAPVLLSIGDAVHNFADGVIVAAAFLINVPLGIVTALAVAAHELPQEITDFSVMLHHGWSRVKVFWTNFGISLTNVLGAIAAYVARDALENKLPYIIAFAAGIFIYIAGTDLFPEITPERSRDKISHILFLVFLGIVVVWVLRMALE
ncbi:MAG: ZIP family metal transporter [bacterium]|nr:ZIP family metal transporter [bacterium]